MPGQAEVRCAELIASLCLATDLGMGLPFEHGLQSTLFAMRLAERVGVDTETAIQTFYGASCSMSAAPPTPRSSAELFDDGALVTHFAPVMFGSRLQTMAGICAALAGSGTDPQRALRVAQRLPRAVRTSPSRRGACARSRRCSPTDSALPRSVRDLFVHSPSDGTARVTPVGSKAKRSRWPCGSSTSPETPRSNVCSAVIVRRGGDPEPGRRSLRPDDRALFADQASDIMALDDETSCWDATLAGAGPG